MTRGAHLDICPGSHARPIAAGWPNKGWDNCTPDNHQNAGQKNCPGWLDIKRRLEEQPSLLLWDLSGGEFGLLYGRGPSPILTGYLWVMDDFCILWFVSIETSFLQ